MRHNRIKVGQKCRKIGSKNGQKCDLRGYKNEKV